MIGFIERGEREVGVSKVLPLAVALGVNVADLFDWTDEDEQRVSPAGR